MAKSARPNRLERLPKVWYNLGIALCLGIIAACVIGCALTVYIFKYIADEPVVDLDAAQMSYTTILYGKNANGNDIEMERLHGDVNRIWVDYDDIPEDMVNAAIALEDKRFREHQGVDWKRTIASAVNLVIPIYEGTPGGSTITQQVVKNVTHDDDFSIIRKVKEILRAMKLEKHYSKEQIMEVYLNTISLGNNTSGVQAAANLYYGKDVSELNVAECASIVSITQNPTKYNPFTNYDNLVERTQTCLYLMHEQGYLSDEEYEEASNYQLVIAEDTGGQVNTYTDWSWFTEQVISDVLEDLGAEKGYTEEEAYDLLYNSGLRVYTTCDVEMQDYLEKAFNVDTNSTIFPAVINEEYPEGAFVVLGLDGQIKAIAGSDRTKTGARTFNRARDAVRHPGSTIKPIASYSLAVENDIIHFSSLVEDSPITITENGVQRTWPVNFYGSYLGNITVNIAIQRSTNTIPVKLQQIITPQVSFNFLKNKLGISTLVESRTENGRVLSDINLAPMALGEMTDGVTPLAMAGAYQIFGNGGIYTEPYSYTRVETADGTVILEHTPISNRVISSESATVLNHLLQGVTTGTYGTGTTAKFSAMPVAGKTGTSDNDNNQWFIGVTPYYVGVCWLGYDIPEQIRYYSYAPPTIYKNIMGPIHQNLAVVQFQDDPDVEVLEYCTITGDLAGDDCETTATGWYKPSNIPPVCDGDHDVNKKDEDEEDQDQDEDEKRDEDEEDDRRSSRDDEDEE